MAQCKDMTFSHPVHNPSGEAPMFLRRDDPVTVILGPPCPPRPGFDVARFLSRNDFVKACCAYDFSTQSATLHVRPVIVKDEKRSPDFRTWKMLPDLVDGRPAVFLEALFELDDGHGGTKGFRGDEAIVTEPFIMLRSMRPVVDHVVASADFDRVDLPAAKGIGWGSCSRTLALMQNYGVIRHVPGLFRTYEKTDPLVLGLRTDKDLEHAPGRKKVYEKTDDWAAKFMPQWAAFYASGKKSEPYVP